jgi:hypothetical protein
VFHYSLKEIFPPQKDMSAMLQPLHHIFQANNYYVSKTPESAQKNTQSAKKKPESAQKNTRICSKKNQNYLKKTKNCIKTPEIGV